MFKKIITGYKNQWALLRSLSAQSLMRMLFLVIISVIPLMLSFFAASYLCHNLFNTEIVSFTTVIAVMIGVSIPRFFYYAKKFQKQDKERGTILQERN